MSTPAQTLVASPMNDATTHQPQTDKLDWMLAQLSPKELEIAARSSFEYAQDVSANNYFHHSTAFRYAKKMADRYLKSKNGDASYALSKLKATLTFRQKMDVDRIRTTFQDAASPYRQPLLKMLETKKLYVQGYDRQGRSTFVFIPRLVRGHDAEWTLKESIYTIERAVAASRHDEINAIIDFEGFRPTKHAPPMTIGKQFLTTLREHYRGQVHKIFILNAPTSFHVLWSVCQPFVGSQTKAKIQFVSGGEQKERYLGELYSVDELADWMIPGGRKNRAFDLEEYLFRTPFDQGFDDSPSQ
jgi:hypothetical protein